MAKDDLPVQWVAFGGIPRNGTPSGVRLRNGADAPPPWDDLGMLPRRSAGVFVTVALLVLTVVGCSVRVDTEHSNQRTEAGILR